jgi:hypothetical protein
VNGTSNGDTVDSPRQPRAPGSPGAEEGSNALDTLDGVLDNEGDAVVGDGLDPDAEGQVPQVSIQFVFCAFG